MRYASRPNDDQSSRDAIEGRGLFELTVETLHRNNRDNHAEGAGSPSALPVRVVEQDQELDAEIARNTEDLMELRWHWTLDESNPQRVSVAAYAREVGRSRQVISRDAHAWQRWLVDQNKRTGTSAPGQPKSASDFRELANLSAEGRQAASAIAKFAKRQVGNVARNSREEIGAVLIGARGAALHNATSVESEIPGVAEALVARWAEAAERAAELGRRRDERRASLSRAGNEHWAKKKAAEADCRPEYLAVRKHLDAARLALENGSADNRRIAFTEKEGDDLRARVLTLGELLGRMQARVGNFINKSRGRQSALVVNSVQPEAVAELTRGQNSVAARKDNNGRRTAGRCPTHGSPLGESTGKCLECILELARTRAAGAGTAS